MPICRELHVIVRNLSYYEVARPRHREQKTNMLRRSAALLKRNLWQHRPGKPEKAKADQAAHDKAMIARSAKFPGSYWLSIRNARRADDRFAPMTTVDYTLQASRPSDDNIMRVPELRQVLVPPGQQQVRPTHFLAIRVPRTSECFGTLESLCTHWRNVHPEMLDYAISPAKWHLTMGVMALSQDDPTQELQKIGDTLRIVAAEIPKHAVRLHGLGTFGGGRVLFSKVHADEGFHLLRRLALQCRRRLGEHGINVIGNALDDYTPHVTVAKIKRGQAPPPSPAPKPTPQMSPLTYAEYQHSEFGSLAVSRVDVCAMRGAGEDGYYPVLDTVTLR